MARIWGRIPTTTAGGDAEVLPPYAPSTWVAVKPDADGDTSYLHLTALIQCFRLNLGESPFYGNFGIPARASVQQQIAPDYSVAFIQSAYSGYFTSLLVVKQPDAPNAPSPTYAVSVIFKNGSKMRAAVAL